MLFIRTDGNDIIASGHIMRCISIADALRERGEESTFLTADRQSEDLIKERGYPVICLKSQWNDWNAEREIIKENIKKYKIERLLIDSYYVTKEYLEAIRSLTKLIYINDLHKFHYPVDLLIAYSINHNNFDYEKEYDGENVKLLLGCRYAPLRKDFSKPPIIIRKQVQNILITSGGSDSFNLLGNLVRILTEVEELKCVKFHVVSGKYNKNYKELKDLAEVNTQICLYQNAANMSEIMRNCDIAISAAGTTVLELCACGIPVISYVLADNQKNSIDGYLREKTILYAGDVQEGMEDVLKRIISCLKKLTGSRSLRSTMAGNMSKITDGNGAVYIADEILKL